MSLAAPMTATLLLIDPSAIRSRRLIKAVARDPRFTLMAHCKTFADAYNLTESRKPAVVAIAAELVSNRGFPMYNALLDALDSTSVIMCTTNADTARFRTLGQTFELPDSSRIEAMLDDLAARSARFGFQQVGKRNTANSRLAVIGASTGGVEALTAVLSHFPADCPPTLVVQHIGHDFVSGFARRLDRLCAAKVVEASDGARIEPGHVYVAPGLPAHLTLSTTGLSCQLDPAPSQSGHRPSVDALFNSVERLGDRVVAALLTGMGQDGAKGLLRIRNAGGHTIAQDRDTCVVYGMPRVAQDIGAVIQQLPLNRIGPALIEAAGLPEKGRVT
ncbi:CheB methylesterase domain-containing protein [Marinibacterium sp. SX1]|uniref:CheB methylesterase domain-containing protein n=1 Tax=Marinibacterium sp. SX1 TaxID=3388424 RepID=UPI003D172526